MTIMYICIQETLNDPDDMSIVYGKLRASTLVTLDATPLSLLLSPADMCRTDRPPGQYN